MAKEQRTFVRTVREYEDKVTIETEYVPEFVDLKLPKKYKFNNGGFLTVFQQAMYNIAKFADLSKGEMKLLIYLLGTAGLDNSICVDLQILQEELNEKRPNISKFLKGLTDRNIVIRKNGYRGGALKTLPFELSVNYDQINYDLAYNGRIKDYPKTREKHPEIIAETLTEIEHKKPNLFSPPEEQE